MRTYTQQHCARDLPPVAITTAQLDALRGVLERHEQRQGHTLIRHARGRIGDGPFTADIRVCPIALAEISSCCDHDADVIAIVEEAQFEQLLVTLSQASNASDPVMTLSSMSDGAIASDRSNR